MNVLNLAIIGAGKAGTNMADAARSCPRVELKRVASRSAESARKLAERFGVSNHGDDLDEVLADPNVDAVAVTSPDGFHRDHAVRAARAGKHVICEKPMCNSVGEAEEMIAAAKENGVKLMIGFCERFTQPCQEAKRRIEADEIGEPVMILARRCHPKFVVRGRDWLNDDETGGVINYAGAHNIDLICWFMNSEPERVYAEMGNLVLKDRDFTDCAVMTFKFKNGGIAALYESFAYPTPYPHGVDRSVEILGTKGCVNVDFMRQPLTIFAPTGHSIGDAVTWPRENDRLEGAIVNELSQFAAAVLDDAPVPTPGETGLRAIKIANAARETARTGVAATI